MATLKYGDKEVALAEDWRVAEQIEAENALNIDMLEAKGGGKMALVFFISIRRVDKEIPAHLLADQVMRMEMSSLGVDEAPDPLDEESSARSLSETEDQQTSGVLHSAHSG